MILLLLCMMVAVAYAVPPYPYPDLDVWPKPSSYKIGGNDTIQVNSNIESIQFQFIDIVTQQHPQLSVLQTAITNWKSVMTKAMRSTASTNTPTFRASIFEKRTKYNPTSVSTPVAILDMITIQVTNPDLQPLDINMNEAYTLSIQSTIIAITSPSVWGVIRAFETLWQTIQINQQTGYISYTPIVINDSPRFRWRGVLLDTSRHYLSVQSILRTLDAMSANKMNVLHWHISDAESFPFVSTTYPDLSNKAAYASTAVYTTDDVKKIISYAYDRGIRVVPELDTPGHTASLGNAFPEIMADCWSIFADSPSWPDFDSVSLDPTKPVTKEVIGKLFDEFFTLFSDSYFHIGGDEVRSVCWNAVPSILSYMQNNPSLATYNATSKSWSYNFPALQNEWTQFVLSHMSAGKKHAIVWEEALLNNFNLNNDTVINVWIQPSSLQKAVEQNYQAIMSWGWYLDRQAPTCNDSACTTNWMWIYTWRDMYSFDVFGGWKPTTDQLSKVLGGEMSSWGENVDDVNIDNRLWQRGSAVSERLWSPASVTDLNQAQQRYSSFRCKLVRRGIQAGPTQPDFCDLSGLLPTTSSSSDPKKYVFDLPIWVAQSTMILSPALLLLLVILLIRQRRLSRSSQENMPNNMHAQLYRPLPN